MEIKKVNRLVPGDRIGICAPSGSFDRERLDRGVKLITEMGFNVYVPDLICRKTRYLAGSDSQRAAVVNALFSNRDIKGIVCARGGFGAMRMLPFVDFEMIKKNPKVFAGFSDATALLTVFERMCGFQVIHGPVVTSLVGASSQTIDSFFTALTVSKKDKALTGKRSLVQGKARGILSGGNLATLCHLTGTQFQPEFRDKILFMEEVSEKPYRIDRMLSQMKMAGVFQGIKGVAAGSFEACGREDMLEEILIDVFDEFQVPVITGVEAGHGKHNFSLSFGTKAFLDAEQCLLICDV
ncbi:MAG: LD-carboxypeptidase [Thermodesulfobacteriota bacterium]|nr:LD-carboxypeptidase [Thermodesulfobacteriota bacterium]